MAILRNLTSRKGQQKMLKQGYVLHPPKANVVRSSIAFVVLEISLLSYR